MFMKKLISKISAPALTLSLIFALGISGAPQVTTAQVFGTCTSLDGTDVQTGVRQEECDGTWTADIATPTTASATPSSSTSWWTVLNPLTWLTTALGSLSILILQLASLLTYLSGIILNFVIQYTVVNMTASFEEIGR
jgi:hypothetical protein